MNWFLNRLCMVLVTALMAAGAMMACSGTVSTQSSVAHTTAQTLNRAQPVWIHAMQDEATNAVNQVCPGDAGNCAAAPMRAAADAVFARWSPVVAAWEGTRIAHDAWRLQLERCRADAHASGCEGPALDSLSLALLSATQQWRCAVRSDAMRRPDLDPFPGTPACPLHPDAGVPADGR